MAEESNTKEPESDNSVVDEAVDDPKTPPEDEVVTNFVKSAAAAKQIVDTLPENTAKQKMFKAILWAIVSLSATLAVPCGSLAFSYGQEKAKTESRTQKKKAEAENIRRKLQLDLLKQIIDVAKKAEFKDPKSVYRLGLIASMVNENHAAFGIKLIEAEKTMKSMSDRLAPVAGLRKRLRESNILFADLKARYKDSQETETKLKKRIQEINTTLKVTKYIGAWRKKKLEKELTAKENDLDYQKARQRFYQSRLLAEQRVRKYFSEELKRQEKALKDTLRETENLRDKFKKKSEEVTKLAKKLESEKGTHQQTLEKFKKAMKEMEKDHGEAEQAIKRLRAELKSERKSNDELRKFVKACGQRLKKCKLPEKKSKAAGGGGGGGASVGGGGARIKPTRTRAVPRRRRAAVRRAMSPNMKATRKYFKSRRSLDGLYTN